MGCPVLRVLCEGRVKTDACGTRSRGANNFIFEDPGYETSNASNRYHSQHLRSRSGAIRQSTRQRSRSATVESNADDRAARLGAKKSAVAAQLRLQGRLRQSGSEEITGRSAARANGQARASRRAEELNAIRRRPARVELRVYTWAGRQSPDRGRTERQERGLRLRLALPADQRKRDR